MNEAPRQRRFEHLPSPDPESVSALADDHPAIVQGLPLFEDSVVAVEQSPRLFVSGENNRKIGRVITKGAWSGLPIYTLTLSERATCTTRCHMYRSCYGNAMPFARRHRHGHALEQKIPVELSELAHKHAKGFVVRLHVLGDFYSVEYVNVWRAAIIAHKMLRVYGYTAIGQASDPDAIAIAAAIEELHQEFPTRFVIRWSDPTPLPQGAVIINRTPEGATVPEGVVCPAERDATACCATCGLCWEQNFIDKTIVFMRHGMGSKKTEKIARAASATDHNGLRRVQALPNVTRLAIKPKNEPPTMLWVKPGELSVDESYQRSLSQRSITLISRIVQNWNWSHFKPPIVVKDEDTNAFYVLDGQHTAIAAASHPDIEQIPIMIVDAEEQQDRARAFIGHNKDRVAMTALQIHHAAVVAGDPEALGLKAVCDASGVTLLRNPPPRGIYGVGDTIAIGALRTLMRLYGPTKVEATLRCLVEAKRAPARADEMRAVAFLLYGPSGHTTERVGSFLRAKPYDVALQEARDIAAGAALPMSEALAAAYAVADLHQTDRPLEVT